MNPLRLCMMAAAVPLWAVTPAAAEPASTAWLEDVSVQAPETSQTVLGFEHQLSDLKARGEGIDVLRLALHAGLVQDLALVPALSMRQRGEEPLRLNAVGARARYRVLDAGQLPQLMVYGGYDNTLDDSRDHQFGVGLAARYALGPVAFNADLRPTLSLGGEQGDALEAWYGLAVGYAWQAGWQARAGLELFGISPVSGSRLSDPTFGEAAESRTFYYGPSLAFASGPFWTAASLATGFWVSAPASQFMLSWQVGVSH